MSRGWLYAKVAIGMGPVPGSALSLGAIFVREGAPAVNAIRATTPSGSFRQRLSFSRPWRFESRARAELRLLRGVDFKLPDLVPGDP
jgi:hypothetical protein